MGKPFIDTNQTRKEAIVNVLLTGGRVTESFRASLFAAAGRAGVSVNEFVLQAAGEKLKAANAPFTGVFATGDMVSQGEPDPFAGGNGTKRALNLGGRFIPDGEMAAYERHCPAGQTLGDWARDLMRQEVERKARASA